MTKILKKFCCLALSVLMVFTVVPKASAEGDIPDSTAQQILLDTPTEVRISTAGEVHRFTFTPAVSGVYSFYSEGVNDTHANIYDLSFNCLANDDDSGNELNFNLYYEMTAGETYILEAHFLDSELTGSFDVTLTKTNIQSLEILDVSVIEDFNCQFVSEYDEDSGQNLEWYRYNYLPEFIVTLEGGDTLESNGGYLEYNGENYHPMCNDNQSYYNQWQGGESYTATGTLFGLTDTFTVNVTQSPVESIEIETVEIIENTDCRRDYWVDEETGNECEFVRYEYSPQFTVNLKGGGSLQSQDGRIEYEGQTYHLNTYDDQTYENQWGIGEHTVTADILGFTTTFTVNIVETPVKSVVYENVELIENADSITDYYYNSETDEEVEWKRYTYHTNFTVTFKDDTVVRSTDGWVEYNGRRYNYGCTDDQGPENEWGRGKHTVTAEILGFYSTFVAEVIASPFKSVSVDNIKLIEGADSETVYYWDPGTGNELEWQEYNYIETLSYTVTLNDGTTREGYGYWFNYGNRGYAVSVDDDQSYYNQWGVGKHPVKLTVLGCSTTFYVEIEENPVQSVAVEDITLIEGVDCYTAVNLGYDGEEIEWQRYDYGIPNVTVTLKGGTQLENDGSSWIAYDGEEHWIRTFDDQGPENEWGVGEHTVTAQVMGMTATFTVEVIENPVVGATVEDINIFENVDSWTEYEYNEETDEWDLAWECYYYGDNASFTVELEDGTVLESSNGAVDLNGRKYRVQCEDDQSYDNQWAVGGEYTVKATVMGYETEATVVIAEDPVISVKINDINLYEGVDDYTVNDYDPENDQQIEYQYYFYDDKISVTVTLKDGTVLKSEDGMLEFNGRIYPAFGFDNQSYCNQWGVGTHPITVEIMGQTIAANVNIRKAAELRYMDNAWYYTYCGEKDLSFTSLFYFNDGWYYVKNGKVDFSVKTLVYFNDAWYYVQNGKVDFGYTGLVEYNGENYYVQKGVLVWGVNGLKQINGTWYYLSNSTVNKSYNSLVQYGGTYYYVQNGKIDFSVTTLVKYGNTWYYVQNGVLKWGVETLVNYYGTWYYVKNSQVDFSANTLVKYGNDWYYVQNGVLKWGVETLVNYYGTWYYVKNSQVDFSANTLVKYGNDWYYIQNGVLKWGVETLVNYYGTWYYVKNSQVDFSANTLVKYGNDWYYVQNGVLKWGVETLVNYYGTWYYVNNSTVKWNANIKFNYYGTCYTVKNGVVVF